MISLFRKLLSRKAGKYLASRATAKARATRAATTAALRASPPAPIRDRALIKAEAAASLAHRRANIIANALRRQKMEAQG